MTEKNIKRKGKRRKGARKEKWEEGEMERKGKRSIWGGMKNVRKKAKQMKTDKMTRASPSSQSLCFMAQGLGILWYLPL